MVRIMGRIAIVALLAMDACLYANAQPSTSVTINYKNHRFQPPEITVPANVTVQLRVKNLDSTPMEFESVSLRVEKVVTGNSEGVLRIRPLAPGRYEFFDDFHPETRGALVAK
jgi:heme/copper-type cytochrome/quinol oxidase subunit 2